MVKLSKFATAVCLDKLVNEGLKAANTWMVSKDCTPFESVREAEVFLFKLLIQISEQEAVYMDQLGKILDNEILNRLLDNTTKLIEMMGKEVSDGKH